MGLFSFTQEIAMDLGTANTIILNNDFIFRFIDNFSESPEYCDFLRTR